MQHDSASHGERPLGYVEHVFKTSHELGSFVVVRVVRISGPLDAEHLRAALTAAQQEIPALRAKINRHERKLQVFEHPELPFKVLKRATDDLWKQVAAAELHQRFVDTSLLWKARFLRSSHGGQHELLFVFHHAISDGVAVTSLVNRVLVKCQGKLEGRTVRHDSQTLFPPVEKLLPQSGLWRSAKFLLDRAAKLLRGHHRAIRPLIAAEYIPTDQRTTTARFLAMSAEHSRRLLDRKKREQATMQGTLCAVMLAAASTLVGNDSQPLSCSSNVDLREACGLGPEPFGCFIYWVETLHRVGEKTNFWQLARECSRSIRVSTRRWGVPPPALFRSLADAAIHFAAKGKVQGRTNAVGVSNLGRINLPKEFGPLRVDEMYSLVGQHAIGNAAHLIGGTLGGQLFISLMLTSPFDDMAADAFMHRFRQAMELASAETSPTVGELVATR